MSLLLDARKKSQQGGITTPLELSLEDYPNPEVQTPAVATVEVERSAGKNLFNAKTPAAPMGMNKNLLMALAATVLLLLIGAAYFWYADTGNSALPVHPITVQTPQSITVPAQQPAVAVPIETTTDNTPDAATTITAAANKKVPRRVAKNQSKSAAVSAQAPSESSSKPIQIDQQQVDVLDPLLNRAYLAYQNGKPDEAQQLYLDALSKDGRNIDALSGLAVIAQQAGDAATAARYFSRILALDPRNAVANAGMSALIEDDNNESRLKTLLHEQKNSAALHFALGNLYADQARWNEAQQEYFSAYTLDENNAELAFNLAISLEHLGQNKPAAQYYQRALQLDQPPAAGFDHQKIEQRAQQLLR